MLAKSRQEAHCLRNAAGCGLWHVMHTGPGRHQASCTICRPRWQMHASASAAVSGAIDSAAAPCCRQPSTSGTVHPTHLQAAGRGVLLLQLLPQALDSALRVGQVVGLMSQLPGPSSCCATEPPALLGQVLHLSLQSRAGCSSPALAGAALLAHFLMWVCMATGGRDGLQPPALAAAALWGR